MEPHRTDEDVSVRSEASRPGRGRAGGPARHDLLFPDEGAVRGPAHAPSPQDPDVVALAQDVGAAMRAVEEVLRDVTHRRTTEAAGTAAEYTALWQDLSRQVGGKMLRPHLTVAAYLGLGGTDVAAVAHVAAAQEVLHTAMLVHDDLLDHDEVRRGVPNVAGSARARLVADGAAGRRLEDQVVASGLLGGDLAIAQAFALVAAAPVDPAVRLVLVQQLADGIATTVAGELLDVRSALHAPADVDTLAVAHLKTAVYTFGVPLGAGAVLAGADDATVASLRQVGEALGVAFQLVDDDLGVFGDPATTGKSVLSDLREGKRTQLLRAAYAAASPQQRDVLDALVGHADLDESGAAAVRAVLEQTGARAATLDLARTLATRAHDLAVTTVPPPLAGYLGGLVEDLVGRGAETDGRSVPGRAAEGRGAGA
ncbi:polyprenyl synthetase family protein [Cellulomonas marina]|uniref:Geranylgeranyl diphosphate synthase, type II n=1 Tax=Cellulomonas marina TaxID=988821 RepID=A0A1I0Z9S3_9CELL|nr:polyprenyl synthetase family protein [Cellulomonas marina]GIG30825.1 geranylgeranyl pyrophosphate synthase [Cellulomonas marina]SFB21330.1 geranylgeranyl diphosphate synthase, type II [Cellulomonas marina]